MHLICGSLFIRLVFLITSTGFPFGPLQNSNEAELLMGSALHLEEVEGKFAEAVSVYQKVLEAKDVTRELAAKAQLRIAICLQRMGRPEARAAFEAVLKYEDQAEPVKQAREHLLALGEPPARHEAPPVLRKIPMATKIDWAGSPSPDGRYLAVNEVNSRGVTILDLETGQPRRVFHASPDSIETVYGGIYFAPSGDRIAYTWMTNDGSLELRISELASKSTQVLLKRKSYLNIVCWAPDEKSILINDGVTESIAALSLGDATLHDIKPLKGIDVYEVSTLSPDGRYFAFSFQSGQTEGFDIEVVPLDGGEAIPLARGRGDQILSGWAPDGKSLFYTDDKNGTVDLWRVSVDEGRAQGEPALIQRDIGQIKSLGITRNGTLFFSRTRYSRDVHIAGLDAESGAILSKAVRVDTSTIGNSDKPAWSPDGRHLAYLTGIVQGARNTLFTDKLAIHSMEDGSNRIWNLGVSIGTGFELSWKKDGTEIIARGLNEERKWIWWRIAPGSGQVLGEGTASTVLRTSIDRTTRIARVFARNLEGEEIEICRGLPDERAIFLSRSMDRQFAAIKMQRQGPNVRTARLVVAATDGSGSRDVMTFEAPFLLDSLAIAPGNRLLYCVVYTQDPDVTELWKVPVDGGGTHQKVDFMVGNVRSLVFQPDGNHVAFVKYEDSRPEVWAMENIIPK